jgi:outer membrane protein assembly factor BamB
VVFAGRNTAQILAWRTKPCGAFQCDQIWSASTNEQIVNSSPTVVNGTVYIGSADQNAPGDISGRIYVYGLPG